MCDEILYLKKTKIYQFKLNWIVSKRTIKKKLKSKIMSHETSICIIYKENLNKIINIVPSTYYRSRI